MKVITTYLFSILLIFQSCNTTKLIISKAENNQQKNTLKYSNFWTAMRCGLPELIENYKPNDDESKFANALMELKQGNFQQSEVMFYDLFKNSNDDTIKINSQIILGQIYIYQSKWKEYYHLFRNPLESDTLEKIRLLYPVFEQVETHSNFSSKIDTLKFDLYRDLIIIPVIINNKTYRFLFDTGAQITTISSKISKEIGVLKLATHSNALIGSTGKSSDLVTGVIENLTVGNYLISNKPCIITDEDNLNFKLLFFNYLSIDGILGWDIIKNLDVEIDYNNNKIIIREPHKKNNPQKNLYWLNHPIVNLKSANGVDLMFFLDLGSQSSSFYDFLLQKLELGTDKSTSINFGIGGSILQSSRSIPKISLLLDNICLNFKNLKEEFSQDEHFIILDGKLGMDIVKNNTVRIDAINGLVSIKQN